MARPLAERHDATVHDVTVHDGDRAEHRWLERRTPERHPRLTALKGHAPGEPWARLSPAAEQAAALAARFRLR